jgi:hypothetical protein
VLAFAGALVMAGGALEPRGALGPDAPDASAPQTPEFSHALHEIVGCTSCHTSRDAHGATAIRTVDDCRSCHHVEPVADRCARCHAAADAPPGTYERARAMSFSVGTSDPDRRLPFPHPAHASLDCASCHSEGLARAVPADFDCASCHEDHHTPEAGCASCHRVAPETAHPTELVHVTCSGSGCHTDAPFQTLPRTRAFCVGCHVDLAEHEPGRVCTECHALPVSLPPR